LVLSVSLGLFPKVAALEKGYATEPGANLIWSIITFSVFYILCRGKIKKEEAANDDQLIA
jgi:hypothetical protein